MVAQCRMLWLATVILLLSGAWAASEPPAGVENVLKLTADNFDQAIKDHSFLVVEFYAPWCGHCKTLAPEWEKAATTLKGDTSVGQAITLGAVDATVERSLAEKFHIGGFPTLKIFEGNSAIESSEYEGPRDADGIVSFLKKRAGPASRELTSAEEVASLKKDEAVIVVNAGELTEVWKKLANSMRDTVFWCHTTNKAALKALGVKAGTIVMIKDFDDKNPVFSGDASSLDKIKEFVDYHRTPVALHIKKGDKEALKIVFQEEHKPNVFLFTNDKDAGFEAFKAAVQDVRGLMTSARFQDADFPEAFQHFGLDKFVSDTSLPKVLIEDRKSGLRYLMEGDVTEKTIKQFLTDYKDEKLDPFLKSEPEPENNSGPVKMIVGTTFDSMVRNAGHWVFLEAYAPWCGHCKKLTPIWEDLGLAFEDSAGKNKVVIAKIDGTVNDMPKAINVKGFPTLMLFTGDGTAPNMYEGGRDYASLSAFVTKETGATVKLGFVPIAVAAEPAEPFDKLVIKFFQTQFQVPFAEDGVLVSGLWLCAIVIFLLFVASISLVIACLGGGAPIPPKNKKE